MNTKIKKTHNMLLQTVLTIISIKSRAFLKVKNKLYVVQNFTDSEIESSYSWNTLYQTVQLLQ
jgi:hypothetical protein